jgi:hypothetical protein
METMTFHRENKSWIEETQTRQYRIKCSGSHQDGIFGMNNPEQSVNPLDLRLFIRTTLVTRRYKARIGNLVFSILP